MFKVALSRANVAGSPNKRYENSHVLTVIMRRRCLVNVNHNGLLAEIQYAVALSANEVASSSRRA